MVSPIVVSVNRVLFSHLCPKAERWYCWLCLLTIYQFFAERC
jgi:hypothetical protein